MTKYRIYAGIDSAEYQYTIDLPNDFEAEVAAYEEAVDIYQANEGSHGIRNWADIAKEMDGSEEDIDYAYELELESRIAYYYEKEVK